MEKVRLLTVLLDLGGTFVFALSGATSGIKHRLDLFGVLVLSFTAATAGGMTRDVLIGAVPPAAIHDGRYVLVSIGAGLVAFYWPPLVRRMKSPVLLFDAVGLGLFAGAGALKSLEYGLRPLPAILLGCLTGVGGGVVRDVLVSEVPAILRSELYATAALAGAAVVVAGETFGAPSVVSTSAGVLLCVALRVAAIRRGWRLPVAAPE
jgi:uncharacterized membrane protein YeiH